MTRNLEEAEDLASQALVKALDIWPRTGLPENPGAWLQTTGRNMALDELRRRRKRGQITLDLDQMASIDQDLTDEDVLGFYFWTCHPDLTQAMQTCLMLKVLAGLTTAEISSAYLLPEATVAQRLVRAKKILRAAGSDLSLPPASEIPKRLASILEGIYLIFNEGYSASSGEQKVKLDLVVESLRLARQLAQAAPDQSEVWGLLALLEFQYSRLPSRQAAHLPTLADQDRRLWDRSAIDRAEKALARTSSHIKGPYLIQAQIAACHARAAVYSVTDWSRILDLYFELHEIQSSPVVLLNLAMAAYQAVGPQAAWGLLERLDQSGQLSQYHWLSAAQAEILEALGRKDDAVAYWQRAWSLATSKADRDQIEKRFASN